MGQVPFSFIGGGTYVNPSGTPPAVNIPLTDRPDWFFVKDLTNWGDTTAITAVYEEWFSSMASGAYLGMSQAATTNALSSNMGASGGFTFINPAQPQFFAKVAVTAIDMSTFAVTTSSTAGLNVGDYVRLINVAGMQQFSGLVFQVTAVTDSTHFTLGYAATAKTNGMQSATSGTTGFYQKVNPSYFYPRLKYVAYVTQANPAKVYFFSQNDFTPGEIVDFQIPTLYGMIQLSNLTVKSGAGPFSTNPAGAARVLQTINSTTESSIVIDIDTTGFTAFNFPPTVGTSTVLSYAQGPSPATCFPAGSGVVPYGASATTVGSATLPLSPPGTNLLDAFDNHAQYYMNVGTSVVGAASATMQWMAFKADYFNAISNA